MGPIGFPLREQDARAISGTCSWAPPQYGSVQRRRDVQTLQRVSWPLSPAKVMFVKPRSTGKEPGMFGTLIICLPSKHERGDIVVSHRRQSITFQTGSTFDHTYSAWYADFRHEVKPITSGYCMVLVYNLIQHSTRPTQSAAVHAREKRELNSILSSWTRGIAKENSKAPVFLTYQLEHEYTDAKLRFQSFKAMDKVKAEHLKRSVSMSARVLTSQAWSGPSSTALARMTTMITDMDWASTNPRKTKKRTERLAHHIRSKKSFKSQST